MDGLISDFGARIESLELKMQAFEHVERDTARVYNQVQAHSENVNDMARKLDDLENQNRRKILSFTVSKIVIHVRVGKQLKM